MITFLRLLFLGVLLGSSWYVAFRLVSLFGLARRWPLRIAIGAAVLASVVAMLSVAQSTSTFVGVLSILGGYAFSFHVFLTLLLLLAQPCESKLRLPHRWIGSSAAGLALATTAVGALWANALGVVETTIPLAGLKKDVVLMQLSDVHLGHHRGRSYLEGDRLKGPRQQRFQLLH